LPGAVFGEIALLNNCLRSASVEAASECVLLEMDQSVFNEWERTSAAHKSLLYTSIFKQVSCVYI
jgi:CRP-like cAMP-binding protein